MPVCSVKKNAAQIPKTNDERILSPHGPEFFWKAAAGAHCGAPATPRPLFACVTGRLHFFDLLHDLIEIVTRRILQWRVVDVGVHPLLPQRLAARQHGPVLLVSGGRRSNPPAPLPPLLYFL